MIDTQTQRTTYAAQWQTLKRKYRLLWAIILTFFPAVFVLGFGGSARLHSIIPIAAVWLCWAALLTVVSLRFVRFPCPWCGRAFFRRGGLNRPSAFEPRCVHCGLRKWATDPTEGDTQ
jgi:predicted RNA-binding Zn-ribbon protein involved in translation (DUF1610 family)